jgi:hypothetical protein
VNWWICLGDALPLQKGLVKFIVRYQRDCKLNSAQNHLYKYVFRKGRIISNKEYESMQRKALEQLRTANRQQAKTESLPVAEIIS